MPRCRVWVLALALSASVGVLDADGVEPVEEPGEASLVATGMVEQVRQARAALHKGEHTWAVRALDQAHEVAIVAASASAGSSGMALRGALRGLREARRAVQNGRLERAVGLLDEVTRTVGAAKIAVIAPAEPERYRGARLLNARGELLGELKAVEGDEAIVVLGGARDVLGVVDLGGIRASVPTSMLVFGPRPLLGPARVVLLTEASRTELARRAILAPAS